MAANSSNSDLPVKRPLDPFRRAVLRGLGVLLPPLLTIVIFLWVGNTVAKYVFAPLEDWVAVLQLDYTTEVRPGNSLSTAERESGAYTLAEQGEDPLYVPTKVYETVKQSLGAETMPDTARGVYSRYFETWIPWLMRRLALLGIFILVLYLFGKFLAAGIGRFFWNQFENIINRVPLVSNVYSSVKQVTDFLFTEPDVDKNFTRVVAVEYPRKGIWTVAFVTGESMLDIESAANESVMTVLIPTSPMPFTGFTIPVKKSETIDLDITIDQAFQFVVSCGVVVPPQQLTNAVARREAEKSATVDAVKSHKSSRDSAPQESTPSLAARTVSDD